MILQLLSSVTRASRGRMEEFVKALRDGIDDEKGQFRGGLIGKFRLTNAPLSI